MKFVGVFTARSPGAIVAEHPEGLGLEASLFELLI